MNDNDSNLRVLMLHDAWQTLNGGGQRHAQSLSTELEKLNVKIIHQGPLHHHIIIRALWAVTSPLWLLSVVRKQSIQIIHAHGFHSVLTAKLIAFFKSVKIVHTVHGSHLMDQNKKTLKSKLENFLLTKIKVDHQWSVTNSFIKNYENVNQPQYIGNGVDLDIFKPNLLKKSKTPNIIWVGRNDWSKGLDIQKKIQEKLILMQPDLCITTIIDGKLSQNELSKKFQNAWIYLMTSRAEGLPLTILEAMACGLPVVSTNVGEIDKIISNNTGRLFNPDKPDTAIKAILEIINDSELRLRLSDNAIRTAKKFSWKDVAQKTYQNYLSILK